MHACALPTDSAGEVDRECGSDSDRQRPVLHDHRGPGRRERHLPHPPVVPLHLREEEDGGHPQGETGGDVQYIWGTALFTYCDIHMYVQSLLCSYVCMLYMNESWGVNTKYNIMWTLSYVLYAYKPRATL